MIVGYARVSTVDQNFNLQIDALKKAGCEKIYQDKVSGSASERKILNEAVKYLRSGDTLVVWRLDRLGRSLKKLIEFTNDLNDREIGFKSVIESIDTTTSTGKFYFHITGAFAELERNLIRERTMAGLEAARARGRNGGRPKAIDSKTFEIALQLYNEKKISVGDMCNRLGIVKRTFYRHLEKHNEKKLNDQIGHSKD